MNRLGGVYLETYLAPLAPWLADPAVTDIWVNRPGEIWCEYEDGRIVRAALPALDSLTLERLARQIAALQHVGFNPDQPLLSASLADGSRVQIVGPPVTRTGITMAIRRHSLSDMTLDALASGGLFAGGGVTSATLTEQLRAHLAAGDVAGFLGAAVRQRRTLLLSGGTSSGKTTLMNALIKEIGRDERLLVIEDAPEVHLEHENAVAMIAARNDGGDGPGTEELLQAALRMRPDRILLGELRGAEAYSFLRAVNTGHPGSITTIHADSPSGALDQIALLSLLNGLEIGWADLRAYVARVVDIVVQLRRVDGGRRVVEILFDGESWRP